LSVPTRKKLIEYIGESYKDSDEELIKLYLETHQFYRKIKSELKKSDLMFDYTNKAGATNPVKNPLVGELTRTVQTLNNLLKSMGLTPAQRKKVVNGDDDDDDFDKF